MLNRLCHPGTPLLSLIDKVLVALAKFLFPAFYDPPPAGPGLLQALDVLGSSNLSSLSSAPSFGGLKAQDAQMFYFYQLSPALLGIL